jgi:hypothetical protein
MVESSILAHLLTAAALLLDRRTGDGAIGTEHATIAGLRTQQCLAAAAFIEILTGVAGHGLLATLVT